MNYVGYAWAALVCYALGSIIGKLAIKYHINNPWLFNMAWAVLTIVFIIPFALAGHVGYPQDWTSMIWLSLASTITSIAFTFAFYAVDLSILSPLSNIKTPIMAVIGVVLFNEVVTGMRWTLIGLIFLAGLVMHFDEKMSLKMFWTRGTAYAFIWIMTSVWFNTLIKTASMQNGYWEVIFWSNLLTLVFTLPTYPLFSKELKTIPLKNYTGVVINTALYTAGLLFMTKALASNVSVTVAITSIPLTLILTMLVAGFKPNLLEKHSAKIYAIRLAAAVVMFGAALGLSN